MKHDVGKTDLSLLPIEPLIQISDVLGFGADKYARDDYRHDGMNTKWSRSYASIQRHLTSFWSGEDIDPESGKQHLAHAATQLLILMTHINDGHVECDDRYRKRES